MKKYLSIILALIFILSLAACSGNSGKEQAIGNSEDLIQTILAPAEYILYQNIFYNDQGGEYVGQEVTKMGIFTSIHDEYNSVTRYYVWGYNDNTKCCDWQWELVPESTDNLPPVGSTVNVTGTFRASDAALDGYRIENAEIETLREFTKSTADVDMTTMGGTLERVQIINMLVHKEKFEGKTVSAYGRVESPTSIQHPYYDNAFSLSFDSDDEVQAIGKVVIVSGVFTDGTVTQASVTETSYY